MTDYEKFIAGKSQLGGDHGFEPIFAPTFPKSAGFVRRLAFLTGADELSFRP